MGNCQAIDNASLLVQHPNGRADKLYIPVTAGEIMKMNPGHYVALLLTTTFCPSTAGAAAAGAKKTTADHRRSADKNSNNNHHLPLRITRIKLLKPTDTLVLGHVYRLITTQEVMKGLWAKKYAKIKKQMSESSETEEGLTAKEFSDLEIAVRKYELEKKTKQVKPERHRSKTSQSANSVGNNSRSAWQPSLQSISEAAS